MIVPIRIPNAVMLPTLAITALLLAACGGGSSGDNNTNGNEQPECGDGVMDSNEECDNGALNSDTVADACRLGCVSAYCGDGVTDSEEGCDGGDFCDAQCMAIESAEVRVSFTLVEFGNIQPITHSCAEAGVASVDFWLWREAHPIDELVFELLGAPCDDLPIIVGNVGFDTLHATVAVYDGTSMMLGNGYSLEPFTHHAVEGTDASLVVELW